MVPEQIKLDPHEWCRTTRSSLPCFIGGLSRAGSSDQDREQVLRQWVDWNLARRRLRLHHYHSGAHEVLGIAAGTGTLAIDGPRSAKIDVSSGDYVVLPAGTGDRNLGSSPDFRVIGAYPFGQQADILTSAPSKEQQARIDALSAPESHPVMGRSEGLVNIVKPLAAGW